MRVTYVTAALLLSAAAILPAQSRNRGTDFGLSEAAWCGEARNADFCEVRENTLKNANTINIDARGNGGVSIRGWDRNDVHVRVRVTAQARNTNDARALANETRLTTSDGRIRMEGPRLGDGGWSRGWREWWSATYEVQVPRNAKVTVDASNGGINVSDVRGSVDAETINGGLSFNDVSGDIHGRVVNGGVFVQLSGSRWQGAGLDVQTTNGGVRLLLPSDFSAELDARASSGGISLDFPVTVQGRLDWRHEVRATLGSGGPPIRVATTNGGIRISRR
jgi:hypothetical protein